MNNDYKSPAFKKLLDSLQQQSWELELLISGFAIFGLFTAYEPVKIEMIQASNEQQIYSFVIYFLALTACSILLFNLLLHVILRGLWIGALGLRYVSGDIEFEKLKYADRFKKYLSKRIVSFDRYIGSLENYCSILFAVSFLLIFYVLALTVVIIVLVLIANFIIDNENLPNWVSNWVGIPLMIFLVAGMFFTFFDFVTQGLLKRNKWIAKIYFPIYWVFSFLTLSFLYRPLVYNFLDNKFGKRLILLLTPIYLLILIVASLEYQNSNYLDKERDSSSQFANKENYMDLLTEDGDFPGEVVIPSKIIRTPYLPIFIPYKENIEDRIFAYDSTLKPKKDLRGLSSGVNFSTSWEDQFDSKKQRDSIRKRYLELFNETHSFKIDTIKIDGNFIVTTSNKGQLGFETNLNIRDIPEGMHILKLNRLRKRKDTTQTLLEAQVPFWYFKE
ncbi:hypothetical protein MTsPCn9_28460 [Croceitalea sp. MTPC9]|uniref:hypothetical protein n=1 Tax=unclassified Croceitalea TaxID=2632280 RepID=UPI002B3B73C4|nr:hypothetical protein MTsPCn6_29950 [Croceitalea sp. MTPC6]GMN17906.1 hypothetical protein MTsPCn9_28460 [Croceitalea sp. MTPC9]